MLSDTAQHTRAGQGYTRETTIRPTTASEKHDNKY
jgi:hypothetical protein